MSPVEAAVTETVNSYGFVVVGPASLRAASVAAARRSVSPNMLVF